MPRAKAFGVRIERVGVKDVVLPGEMKTLLNRVIEAEKEAAANVILRREETAAMRSLANTARVMADHPVLLRLKEQMYPGGDSSQHWPTLGLNTLRWAKKQGAITGPAHSGWGLQPAAQGENTSAGSRRA